MDGVSSGDELFAETRKEATERRLCAVEAHLADLEDRLRDGGRIEARLADVEDQSAVNVAAILPGMIAERVIATLAEALGDWSDRDG
jgi:hypothetical protein